MSTLKRFLRAESASERGQIIVMMGLMVVVLFAIAGLAIDVGRLYKTKAELMRSADAAALAGVLEMNGTSAGLTAAEDKAESYFDLNETGVFSRNAVADGIHNELTVTASKTVDMIFLGVFGIGSKTVNAHAKAGLGTQYMDAVMALDATESMRTGCNSSQNNAGCPIYEAKQAAIIFKNILLGSSPQGNVKVGVTAFRGCFKPTPITHTDCVDKATWKRDLSYNSTDLNTTINAMAGGGSATGTNVCTGLAMGWDIISGTGNHADDILYPGNRSYLILLSDGDNYYAGNNTYQGPLGVGGTSSPSGTTVAGTDFPCQPHSNCDAIWTTSPGGSPCHAGVNTTSSNVTENWDSGGFNSGSNWVASSWTRSGATAVVNTNSPQGGSYHLQLKGSGSKTASDDFNTSAWTGGSGWDASNWTNNSSATKVTTPTPQGSHQVRLVGNSNSGSRGWIYRQVDLGGMTSGTVSFFVKKTSGTSISGGEAFRVQYSTNSGGSWQSIGTATVTNNYPANATSLTLPTGALVDNVWIRFFGDMSSSSDTVYLDTVNITANSNNGDVSRSFSLSGQDTATGTYYIKRNANFGGSDNVQVQVSADGSNWTTVTTHNLANNNITTSYVQHTLNLTSYVGDSSVYLRFLGDMDSSADEAYIDTISITRSAESPADGYLNGGDGSNPADCDDDASPRERQLDSRTIKLAQAIKAQGVEIFVVAFASTIPDCNLGSNTIYNDEVAADCNAIDQTTAPNPLSVSGPAGNGPIGNNTRDTSANYRLLMCIASNTQGDNDHYFYASSASELTEIFTAIANQISHRLIE